jgi:hypothetical protein
MIISNCFGDQTERKGVSAYAESILIYAKGIFNKT